MKGNEVTTSLHAIRETRVEAEVEVEIEIKIRVEEIEAKNAIQIDLNREEKLNPIKSQLCQYILIDKCGEM